MVETATVEDTASGRAPGRPRDTTLEAAVLAATVDLLLEGDTRDVTIAAITERSGVSRAAVYRRWASREELLAAALDSVRSGVELTRRGSSLETILSAYEQAAVAVDGRVGKLVKKRVALGLENESLRALSWERHVSRRRAPIAAEIRRGIEAGELDPSVDVEAMIDLINGLYYYQFVVRADSDDEETRSRVHAAVKLVWEGALRRPVAGVG
ncbi:TetR/AcrR family transcriptional regulator [Pseudarthrobacter sulfonivorans]|uniref:TetR/AcrR family transcriptional regulator n=1 Tax=Pseudarthrobacter sulfonivorans TaxID=121292 RepID=UPI000A960FA0|nr:TetR/AcrR family transcriptional regulator [Pseudarthrobacter sulfonivorans]